MRGESVHSVKDVLEYGRNSLLNNHIDSREARLLLAYSMGISTNDLIKYEECSEEQYLSYIQNIEKRISGIPYAYITGRKEFMKLDFKVNNHTLIPREDTEILVQKAIEIIGNIKSAKKFVTSRKEKVSILDMCTGSGCIAISIAKYVSNCVVDAVDISKDALLVAKENAKNNQTKVNFIQSNLFQKVNNKYDIILSNPPYIESSEINNLQKEVQAEPNIALDGGKDGLDFYRKISKDATLFLKENGILMFEIGFKQASDVSNILVSNEFKNVEIIKDLSGNDRVIIAVNNHTKEE